MFEHIAAVPLDKAYRLLNHGPTTLISARHDGVNDVMAAAWVCALDFSPAKLTVVLDKQTKTRELVEQSGKLVVQVPTLAQLDMTHYLGTHSLSSERDKLSRSRVTFFERPDHSLPFVAGCSAWMACEVIPEPHNQDAHDLFIVEVVAAWSDTRAFKDGHWQFETAGQDWASIHYIAGRHFYAIGKAIEVERPRPE